jgi:hypothetical protein
MEKIKSHWLKGESGIDTFDENDFSKWRQKKESHKEFKELLKELLREPLFWNIISIIILILLSLILCEAIFGSS